LNLALIGYGNVGRAFARLLEHKRAQFPFRIVAIHTARHGTAFDPRGLAREPVFGEAAPSVEDFLDRSRAEVVFELSPLSPADGEPAIRHIRAAFARGMHVVTANKGPIAHAYADLRMEALRNGAEFRFESTVMDGAPVFNMARASLQGVEVKGFTGVLNSTSNVVIEAMERGLSLEDGIAEARRIGIAEADPGYDIDGWDSAAKTAALANVLMDARTTPLAVDTKGIRRLTPEKLGELKAAGKTVRLVSRAHRSKDGLKLRVRAEVLGLTDPLASARATSNILLLHTDLMGTIGIVEMDPGVEQTAYGLLSDLIDIARTA
jgi:homoserine dehydrogenase